MNPENCGEMIKFKHSHLWRKPLHYEKPVPESNPCHKQLNERISSSIQSELQDKAGALATTLLILTLQLSEINQRLLEGEIHSNWNNF